MAVIKGLAGLFAALGAGGLAIPDEAEGAWKPWVHGQRYLPWMDDLLEKFKTKDFSPYENQDIMHPSLTEKASRLFDTELSGNVRIPTESFKHMDTRRLGENKWPENRLIESLGHVFGSPTSVPSLQEGRNLNHLALTRLEKGKPTGSLVALGHEKTDLIPISAMWKNADEIGRIRKKGEELLGGRRTSMLNTNGLNPDQGTHNGLSPFSLEGLTPNFDTQQRLSAVSSSSLKGSILPDTEDVKAFLPPFPLTGGALTASIYGAPDTQETAYDWSLEGNNEKLRKALDDLRRIPKQERAPLRQAKDWEEFESEWSKGNRNITEPGLEEPWWSPTDLPAAFAGGVIGAIGKPILKGLAAMAMDLPATLGMGYGIEGIGKGLGSLSQRISDILPYLPANYSWGI